MANKDWTEISTVLLNKPVYQIKILLDIHIPNKEKRGYVKNLLLMLVILTLKIIVSGTVTGTFHYWCYYSNMNIGKIYISSNATLLNNMRTYNQIIKISVESTDPFITRPR